MGSLSEYFNGYRGRQSIYNYDSPRYNTRTGSLNKGGDNGGSVQVYGVDFALVKQDRSRTIVGYELRRLEGSALSEWHEVYFPRKVVDLPSIEQVKEAVNADIDAQTDAKILNSYEFTPDGASEPITVWLSKESQTNFSEAHRLQIVPVKFKLNETEDKQPVYHTFETMEDADDFYLQAVAFVNQTLAEGWQRKDALDWEAYEAALEALKPRS